MKLAIAAARHGLERGQSPFGAVIVKGDELIANGHNEVWLRGDPTAHAEVVAIQNAARALDTINLSGCRIYSTCEPCPMCAAAIHWSRLDEVYFGASIADAREAGFNELGVPIRELYDRGGSRTRVMPPEANADCCELFEEWRNRPGRRNY